MEAPLTFLPDKLSECLKAFLLPELFAIPFRPPNFSSSLCYYSTQVFYTPEKPGLQSAFRVSTFC